MNRLSSRDAESRGSNHRSTWIFPSSPCVNSRLHNKPLHIEGEADISHGENETEAVDYALFLFEDHFVDSF